MKLKSIEEVAEKKAVSYDASSFFDDEEKTVDVLNLDDAKAIIAEDRQHLIQTIRKEVEGIATIKGLSRSGGDGDTGLIRKTDVLKILQ